MPVILAAQGIFQTRMILSRKNILSFLFGIFGLAVLMQLPGCYYVQAARGHFKVMDQRRPVEEVLADLETDDELKARLEIVQQARDFAVTELLLPDNDSYRSYSDLGRDYVVWNVFAAPEFSLQAKRWCFPVAGCVAYRGYFEEEAARKFAARLSKRGFDVAIGGVAAYSTLGRFDDPILNTMMRWSDVELVSTIFHELAHQRLYVKGDTAFNESFATAVAAEGTRRWLAERQEEDESETNSQRREVRSEIMARLNVVRRDLEVLYESDLPDEEKRERKRAILDALSTDAGEIIAARGSGQRNWLAAPLNNARIISIGLYGDGQNAFSSILAECRQDLECFYGSVERLAELPAVERKARLDLLTD